MNTTLGAAESTVDPKRPPLYFAAINCAHRIDDQSIAMYVDSKLPGTALSQLKQRLVAASIADGASADHADLICRAALSCPSRITDDCVRLFADRGFKGNALHQLSERIGQARREVDAGGQGLSVGSILDNPRDANVAKASRSMRDSLEALLAKLHDTGHDVTSTAEDARRALSDFDAALASICTCDPSSESTFEQSPLLHDVPHHPRG